jgi:hypothetical protein
MKRLRLVMAAMAASMVGTLAMPLLAHAVPTTVAVRPSNTMGWSSTGVGETRFNGHVNYVTDAGSPLPSGAIQLSTDNNPIPGQDKAQYMMATSTPLSSVNTVGYSTKQIAATSFVSGDASFQIGTCLYGVTAGACTPKPANATGSNFTTFVYEPYVDKGNAAVVNNVWQTWDVANGKLWSSKDAGFLVNTQGSTTYTLPQLKAGFPNAVVYAIGLNVGSNNAGYIINADKVVFNETTYNFEFDLTYPSTKADCTGDGWMAYSGVSSRADCLDYVKSHSHILTGDITYNAYGLVRRATVEADSNDDSGTFTYRDGSLTYLVKATVVRSNSTTVWLAGQVTTSTDNSLKGKWLFAKFEDGTPDKISGSFTDQATAVNGVKNKLNPADGPFNALSGNIRVISRP